MEEVLVEKFEWDHYLMTHDPCQLEARTGRHLVAGLTTILCSVYNIRLICHRIQCLYRSSEETRALRINELYIC